MSPCHLLLFIVWGVAIAWVIPDILSIIGRMLGGIWRLVKRHPAISLIGAWIVLAMMIQ
jgi:hypothetical protein